MVGGYYLVGVCVKTTDCDSVNSGFQTSFYQSRDRFKLRAELARAKSAAVWWWRGVGSEVRSATIRRLNHGGILIRLHLLRTDKREFYACVCGRHGVVAAWHELRERTRKIDGYGLRQVHTQTLKHRRKYRADLYR